MSVVVDAGWSKHSHNHTCTINLGVGVIFGSVTGRLIFFGERNKYCSVCSVAKQKESVKQNRCYKNWTGSSTLMEADIIIEGFNQAESMHRL